MISKENQGRNMDENRIQDILTTTGSFNKEINYWLEQLSGDLVKSHFPYDYFSDEPSGQKKVSFRIEGEMFLKITKICGGSEVKLFGLLAASLSGLLYRYTGNHDILLAAPIYTQEIDTEFINTVLPLRIKIKEESSFKDIVYQVRDVINDASIHQNCPLLEIINMINTEGYLALLETIILVANVHRRKYIDSLKPGMIFSFTPGADSIDGEVEYNSSLYKKHTIEKITTYLLRFIQESLVKKDAPIKDVVFITPEEKSQLLYAFNDTDSEYSRHKTIHEFFEAQVKKKPHCIAAVFENSQITYGELNKRSNQLARILRKKRVNAGNHIVGIMVERSLEMIIGIFAILKAGGAYLPVDPAYPAKRIKFMLEDSGIRLLLTQKHFQGNPGWPAEEIDLEDRNLYKEERENLSDINPSPTSTGSNNLAYVIYTSGSTGKPKGVIIEHHSLVNRLSWMQKRYPLEESDTLMQKTPFTFDVSVWEMFWWSIKGAKVIYLIPGGEKDPKILVDNIEKTNVSIIHFVPSMLNIFIEYLKYSDNINQLSGLKHVFASGEELLSSHVEQFNELLYKKNGTILINLYGPTEATIDVSYFLCSQVKQKEIIPIGKPIDNIRLYIMDKHLHIQPPGIPGELCISGVGLARGYLNRPQLTAERFLSTSNGHLSLVISSPAKLSKVPNDRLYTTGDLARWLTDGNIEFLGRIDHQVKIRGFRIELREIENQLLNHGEIEEAVVLAKEDEKGNKYLCAYIASDKEFTVTELRNYLLKTLPEYMLPSYFISLDKIPLTANGKIDRKALEFYSSNLNTGVEYVEPESELEKIIATTWKEVLEVDKVGLYDNFFDLGGNSLKVIRLNNELNERLGTHIPVVKMFNYVTIDSFAKYITRGKKEEPLFNPNEGIDRAGTRKRARQKSKKQRTKRKRVQRINV